MRLVLLDLYSIMIFYLQEHYGVFEPVTSIDGHWIQLFLG